MKRVLGTFIWLLVLSGCIHQQKIIKKKVSITPRCHRHDDISFSVPQTNPPITIWVHGTRIMRRPLYYSFFEGKPGFKKATHLDTQYHLREVANILSITNPSLFPLDTFYLFGWSGKLQESEREEAALAFHTELPSIINSYKEKYKTDPFIRIICHSHGGNVVLNLAKIKSETEKNLINELILLACPVQKSTMDLITDPMFEKVFSFYSSLDLVQIIAPQIIYKVSKTRKGKTRIAIQFPLLSDQRFPFHENITQIKIKMNNRAILHGEFTTPPFLSSLSQIVAIVQNWITHELSPVDLQDHIQLLCIHTKKPTHEMIN